MRVASKLGVEAALAAVLLLVSSAPASAIEFWDGRLQIHGFYEQQIRSIWTDFSCGRRSCARPRKPCSV